MANEDKRRYPRFNSLNLSYVLVDGSDNEVEKQTMGRTLDVSEVGIRLETSVQVEVGCEMLLSVGLEDDVLDIRGRVVHSSQNKEGKNELGVEFLDKDAAASETLIKFIKAFRQQRGIEE
jgi:c-di-GMP-binding flagellar brake protein YcgR